MKNLKILLLFLAGLCLPVSCEKDEDEPFDSPELLKQVLFDFYDGVTDRDFEKIKEATTADFMLYMEGKAWSIDSIVNAISAFPPFTVDYSFDDFGIYMEYSVGSMLYLCHADYDFGDGNIVAYDWYESATFVKSDDQWKMKFLQSTTKL